jgi:predicted N-acetyltransferase YhbS
MEPEENEAVLDLLEHVFNERRVFELYMQFDPELNVRDTLLAACNGKLVSCVQIFTKRVRLRGKPALLGGIGSVATDPAHRGRGLATELLHRAIAEMEARGMALSLLFTGRLSFYERLSWLPIPHTRLALHAADASAFSEAGDLRVRPYRESDRATIENLYERYAATFETTTIRDRSYWHAQLQYARGASPDEEFQIVERKGQPVCYARKIDLEGAGVAMEYARKPDAAEPLAALLAGFAPKDGALIVPWGGDEALEAALRLHADRIDRISDTGLMWRVLNRAFLQELEGSSPGREDVGLLEALVGGTRALYWPSDRF